MSARGPYKQHPLAKIRREVDWSKWLGDDTVTDYGFESDCLTVESQAIVAAAASVLVSGAVDGETKTVDAWVEDSSGEKKYQPFEVKGVIEPEKISKYADDELILTANYGFFLTAGNITASDWTVPSGITGGVEAYTSPRAFLEISGGTEGQTYRLTNVADTSAGERLVMVFDVYIKPR